ncbi:MAG: RNA-protein complex protein Nop10 [Methanobrevibacter sp.]|nr:RNA-protein complex protein Nop10 [Methanobrevibacter sp.]
MKLKMHKCEDCGEYTLKSICPYCGEKVKVIYPAKYSIDDKYGKYRRKLKEEMLNKQV